MNKILIADQAHIIVVDGLSEGFRPLVQALQEKHLVRVFKDAVTCMAYLESGATLDLLLIDGDALSDTAIQRLLAFAEKIHAPVVMGFSMEDIAKQEWALSFEALDYITKPYCVAIELFRIEKHIHHRRSLQIAREQNRYFGYKISEHASNLINAGLEMMSNTKNVVELEKEILLLLSRVADYRDPETAAHLQRMSRYAKLIAKNLGLSLEEQTIILEAAPLHDIGKLAVPDEILFKSGLLTPAEMETMKQHAPIGYEILKNSSSPLVLIAAEVALTHHEKFDGTGYPNRLKGEDIPLYGRIAAVADVFDALTSTRPYKAAWTLEDAAEYLREQSGKHFDPRCVDAFLCSWAQIVGIHYLYNA